MRAAALALRGSMASAGTGDALARTVLTHAPPARGAVVAGFFPMGDEIDVLPLLIALHGRGHPLALPVTTPRGEALHFRTWKPGAPLEPGRFGTSHPMATDEVTPDHLLVPLLAFDARGHRLGYGGGYYDRTLAGLPHAFRLGVAFAAQQVPEVPTCPTDVPMHAIATELALIRV